MTAGIIFDMDGVLCDSEPFICEAAVAMFRLRHGVAVLPSDFHPFTGMGEDRFLGGVAEQYGVTLDAEADKVFTYTRYLELIHGRLQPMNGVASFLKACRARGFKLAVASSADRMKVAGNLEQIGLSHGTFDAVVDGSMVARKKPAPDIFLLAAARIGVAPETCVVFEDAVSGIRAACAAGMRAIGVRSSFDEATLRAAGACLTVRDLAGAESLNDPILARPDRCSAE
jgi:beta-phosphoglucomutase